MRALLDEHGTRRGGSIVSLIGWLNAWGGAWAGFMVRALVDSSVLLAVLLLVWLPLRRRMSAQLAHGLFLLVLLKLALPVSDRGPRPGSPIRHSGTIRTRVTSWLDQGSPPALRASAGCAGSGSASGVSHDRRFWGHGRRVLVRTSGGDGHGREPGCGKPRRTCDPCAPRHNTSRSRPP